MPESELNPANRTRPALTVDVRVDDSGVPVLLVAGEVDMATAPRFGEAVSARVAAGEPFVVDLEGVDFLSSAGLAVLVDAREQTAGHDLRWAVVATRPTVTRPLEITGLLDLLPVHGSLADAVTALTR